jgi:hypothetical protein
LSAAAYRRNWQILKQEHPTSGIAPEAIELTEHCRNCRIWKDEHPASAVNGNVHTEQELRRFFAVVFGEL